MVVLLQYVRKNRFYCYNIIKNNKKGGNGMTFELELIEDRQVVQAHIWD